jgi:hypothetical protein
VKDSSARRLIVGLVLVAVAPLAACSSSHSAGDTSTTAAPQNGGGLTGLGTTSATWAEHHHAVAGVPDGSAYGPFVRTDVGPKPRFSSMRVASGRVAGWTITFSSGTRLAGALVLVRAELPRDARQVASWSGSVPTTSARCEVIEYQSAELALALPARFSGGAFGVVFSVEAPRSASGGSVSLTDKADVGAAAATPDSPCPS